MFDAKKILDQLVSSGVAGGALANVMSGKKAKKLAGSALKVGGLASAEHAAEVYAASLLMLDPPSPPEQIYLDTLAGELGLDAGLVAEIRATLQADRVTA